MTCPGNMGRAFCFVRQVENYCTQTDCKCPELVRGRRFWLIYDASHVNKSRPDSKVLSAIRTVRNKIGARAFDIVPTWTSLELDLHKWRTELHSANDVCKRTIDSPSYTARLITPLKNNVRKGCIENAKIDEPFINLAYAVDKEQNKERNRILATKNNWVRSRTPQRTCQSIDKLAGMQKVHLRPRMSWILVKIKVVAKWWRADRIKVSVVATLQ